MAENDIELMEEGAATGSQHLFGRREILTSVDEITPENLLNVLDKALSVHAKNRTDIDYLDKYMRGQQPILGRKKTVRPEICNRVVENHASEIVQFTSGYFLGEPVTYVRRGDRKTASKEISLLNDYMFNEGKASHDKDLATWMAICGVGYRMALPGQYPDDADFAPFEIDTPDPRDTFVVYNSGFGHRRMMGVRLIYKEQTSGNVETWVCGYTRDHYFEVKDSVIRKWVPNPVNEIPIFEYRLNMSRMGSFEAAIPLLDSINNIMSNRVDGVEQFVQSFLKFINCEVDEKVVADISKLGAIFIKSAEGMNCDVELISRELNQQQTQTLVDYLYDQVLVICGMPTTKKGGTSTSDTGMAVLLRDGWTQAEARAKDTELLFKRSEKEFLHLILRIIRDSAGVEAFDLGVNEVECKFTRRQHDNLQSKTQALLSMLQAGLEPGVAIATCGLFNDPMDVTNQSKKYLTKWDPVSLEDVTDPEEIEVIKEDDGQ